MSPMREEIRHLVDQLPEERLAPDAAAERRAGVAAVFERLETRLRGVTGGEVELLRLRDGDRS